MGNVKEWDVGNFIWGRRQLKSKQRDRRAFKQQRLKHPNTHKLASEPDMPHVGFSQIRKTILKLTGCSQNAERVSPHMKREEDVTRFN